MIITKTPFRMSFFGGGTDYQPFFEKYGGSVLSTTFDKYCYTTVRHLPRFFEFKNQLTYSTIENALTREDIKHPLVREAMKWLNMDELHIAYDADLPARSGLGSSSSFACGLLSAFHALKGQYISSKQLAKEAIYLERILCDESGGWQDQIAVSYGGFNRINFSGNDFEVTPLLISKEKKNALNDNLMLFFTGFSRISSDIAKEQVNLTDNRSSQLLEILSLVDDAEQILVSKNCCIDDFGKLLNHTWKLKRGITNKISTSEIDVIYETAIKAGALGGKLLGAGGGGFFVFYVPYELQKHVKDSLDHLLYVPFRFEDQGTKVLYYNPEDFSINE